MFELQHLDHVAITVRDLEHSIRWYKEVLGMEHRFQGAWGGVPVMLGLGPTWVALFPADIVEKDVPLPAVRVAHFAFRSDQENFVAARRELESKGIPTTFQDHDISHSIYFEDPDGHKLEITTYDI
jgi:catechol 2,3-dioxygenase-like lactoylglutathione lyase family enzyme